jgi:hypothetical protein
LTAWTVCNAEERLMADVVFPTIAPAPVRDYRTIDFAADLLNVPPGLPHPSHPIIPSPDPNPPPIGGTLVSAVWTIDLEPSTEVYDPSYLLRLIGQPVVSLNTTSHLVGDMVAGAVYVLTATATADDGRVFVKTGELVCMVQHEPVHPPPNTGEVPFDYDRFVSAFPAFAGVNTDTLERMWIAAGLLFRNNWTSPEQDKPTRAYLLGLLTAHIATLFAGPPGSTNGMYGGGGMVGRINSKSVDGVSLSADGFPGVSGTSSWYLSTQYGALFWKMTAAYRTMTYIPGPQRFPSYGGIPMMPYGRRFY